MQKEDLIKYINKRVYLVLKNGFEYKFFLRKEYIKNTTLSFFDKFNNPVDVEVSDISFITISNDTEIKNDR